MPEPARVTVKTAQKPAPPSRFGPLDFVAAAALGLGAFFGARVITRTLGFAPGLFFFVIGAGLAYYYYRGAWNAVHQARAATRKNPR